MMPGLALALLLQVTGLSSGTAADYALPMVYRISGHIEVGLDQPLGGVAIVLKPMVAGAAGSAVAKGTQSFANGTFRFDNVQLGTYTLEVSDSRFNLYRETVLLREASDTTHEFLIRLTRLGEPGSAPTPDVDLYTIDADTKAHTPAKAMDEFNKGVDAIRNPARNNPPDAHFKRAIAAEPKFYEAHIQLGLEQQRQKKNEDAIQSFEQASAIRPAEARPLSILGQLYLASEKFDKVVDVLSRLNALGKMSARDHFALGTAQYRQDHLPAAQEHLIAAINGGNDTDPAPFLQLHNVFMKMHDGARALAVLDDYLKLFPTDPNHAAMAERAEQIRKMTRPRAH